MSFFDSKEEVIKLELTTHGKHLLSKGKFKPVYYSFHDEDVLYDSEYADLSETQNSTQTRILEETPFLKPQATYTSVENSVNKNKSLLLYSFSKLLKQQEEQLESDRDYALYLSLANSAYNNIYAPAWNISVISGAIASSVAHIDNLEGYKNSLSPYTKIPQINLSESLYKYKVLIDAPEDTLTTELNNGMIVSYISGSSYILEKATQQEYVINVKEENVNNIADNFDIEVFVEQDRYLNINDAVVTSSYWKKLNFKKQIQQVKNNILLDTPLTFEVEENNSIVEYFLDITIDDELQDGPRDIVSIGTYSTNITNDDGPFGEDC